MKKLVSMLLVLTMAMSLLTGCGGNSDNSSSDADTVGTGNSAEDGNNTESDSEAADGEVYEMVMEIINFGFDDPDLQMVQDAVNEITVPEIGVKVTFLTVPIVDMATKLGLLVSGGEKIDLVCTGILTNPATLAADGLIQPITEYVEQSEALSSLAEGIIDACKVGDEIYAYPGSIANGNQMVYFYDADLAEEYNIKLPERIENTEDWEELYSQIKASGMEQYATSLGDGIAAEGHWTNADSLGEYSYFSYGVVMEGTGDVVENYYATEEYKEKCKLHREWYEKGYVVPDSNSNGYSISDSMTQGVIFGFVSQLGVSMNDAYWTKITGKNIRSIPINEITTKASDVINFSWGVSSSCERPDKVVEFLELLYTNTELGNIMNYGIEGIHYVTNEGSQIISYPEGIDSANCGYGSYVGTYGDATKVYQREPLTEEFIASIADYMYPNASMSKYMGYVFDTSAVTTELTAVTAVIGQYAPALECGIVDPEMVIPEFLEALEAAGMSKIIEENQTQLTAWLAEQ